MRSPMPFRSLSSSSTAHRHVHGKQLLLVAPERVELAPDAGQHGHAVALGEQLQEVQEALVRAADDLLDAVLLLLRGEVGREEEQPQLAVVLVLERIGELVELVVHLVEHVVLLGGLEQSPRVDLGDLLHLVPATSILGQDREVDLLERLLDQAALVVLVERLAGDLLGGEHGERRDLLADLVERPAGLGDAPVPAAPQRA